jgi:transposase InsO family protein
VAILVSKEETSAQARVLFEEALGAEGLAELLTPERLDLHVDDPARPLLLALSDNGLPMRSAATKAFMLAMPIVQHHGRPHTPTDRAQIETLFAHVKGERPHPGLRIDDAELLEA